MPKSNQESWLEIVRDYCATTGAAEYSIADVVAWAKDALRWEPDAAQILNIGIGQCRQAIRAAELETASGGKIRQFIAARIRQQDLWADVRKCSYAFALEHVRQQCSRLAADHQSLNAFVNEFNSNYLKPGQPPLQLRIDWEGGEASVA